jgi:hypothetical protein
VEKLVADQLIAGNIARGRTIELVRSPGGSGELEIRAI